MLVNRLVSDLSTSCPWQACSVKGICGAVASIAKLFKAKIYLEGQCCTLSWVLGKQVLDCNVITTGTTASKQSFSEKNESSQSPDTTLQFKGQFHCLMIPGC